MRKFITVNGKRYLAKEFDFNTICDLDEMGISIADARKKPMSLIRAYIALSMDEDREVAGKEMEEHMVNGGTLDEVIKIMLENMEESDFFRNLNKGEEEETPTTQTKKSKQATNR